jgi:hypothetical protein
VHSSPQASLDREPPAFAAYVPPPQKAAALAAWREASFGVKGIGGGTMEIKLDDRSSQHVIEAGETTPSESIDRRLLLLSERDDVVAACANLQAGEVVRIDGDEVRLLADVPVGFKIARRDFVSGEKVTKYGAPIGSVTAAIKRGEIVHLHNMKSDYLPTYVHDGGVGFTKR